MAIAAIAMGLVAFAMKETLFDIVLAPSKSDFFLYRIIGAEPFDIKLINTGLAEQFTIHMKVALTVGLLVASPYILYLLFHFVSPALYENEKRYSVRITLSAYLMFIVGVALNYFLVFPLTVRFLGTYSVSADIENMLTLSSYVVRHHLRVARGMLAVRQVRLAEGGVDDPLSPPRYSSDTDNSGNHNAHRRHLHVDGCFLTYLYII